MSEAKLQIPKFNSGQKQLEHVPVLHYGQNSIGTLLVHLNLPIYESCTSTMLVDSNILEVLTGT